MDTTLKNKICTAIDDAGDALVALALDIHAHPELAFNEHRACRLLTDFLRGHGFTVETGVAGLETAFRAEHGEAADGAPTVAFLSEYDALPGLGHACGHNLIAIMGAAAGLGLAKAGLPGRVVVLGTPAEEGLGGKIIMAEKGLFDGLTCAMMLHPANENLVNRGNTALCHIRVRFTGKSAHSSCPEDGVNALSAVMQTFDNIDRLRALMPLTANVNGFISEGGHAANIIPETAACEFTARAATLGDLRAVTDCIKRAVQAAEVLYGARAEVAFDHAYAEFYPNRAINAAFKTHMRTFGVEMYEPVQGGKYGSSDIGNVSLVTPSMHAYVDIGANDCGHTADFAAASASEKGLQAALLGAKGMALTGCDILTDETLRAEISREFAETVPRYGKESFNL